MLQLDSISKSFNGRSVLRGLSCQIARGDFVVLMGPNGAGKSTLFDIISGKVLPDAGRILMDGVDITGHDEQRRALKFGRLFQNTYLGSCSQLTIRENLALATLKGKNAGLRLGIGAFSERVQKRLESLDVDFDALLDVPMGVLSGGQRQMISFVMATLERPALLLLDEPTAALDPISATKLLTFAKNYAENEEVPTLLITHDPMIAQRLGTQEWVLDGGALIITHPSRRQGS